MIPADFHFLRPYWLLAVLPVLIVYLGFLRGRDEHSKWKEVIDAHLLEHLLIAPKDKVWLRPVHVLAVLLTLSVAALAGPSFRLQPSPFMDDQAGLMILLKVAPTMNSRDVQPSRLARAKHKIRDLIEIRKGSATGLIAYSGSAHLVMPMTKDTRIINAMIEDLTPDLMPRQGDALQSAMTLAAQFIEQADRPGSILIITDTVSPGEAASLPQINNLPVQFLSMLSPGSSIDAGMEQLAASLKTSVTELTADSSDVEHIASRTTSSLTSISSNTQGLQWRDEGYWLLPVIAVLSLLWFRKGWVIR